MTEERRTQPRKPAVLAVALRSETKDDRHGVTRDLSPRGLLIVTPSRFTPGERIALTVHAGGNAAYVEGRVARVDVNPVSSPELWRYRMGVELEQPLSPDFLTASEQAMRVA